MEGARPVQDDDAEGPVFRIVPGVFLRIALKAKADPGQRYAIFIDEINRGNIAKIFGELITLVEPDKRAFYSEDGDRLSGMELTLPYSGGRFGVPKNLDLYGGEICTILRNHHPRRLDVGNTSQDPRQGDRSRGVSKNAR